MRIAYQGFGPAESTMQVLLRISNGKSNVRKVRLQADTIIGRSPECQLKVASNQISRRHCQILIREVGVAIKDLGSANGTFVNGRRLPPDLEVPLTPGTRIMAGPLQFTIEYDLPGFSTPTPVSSLPEEAIDTVAGSSLESVAAAPPPEVRIDSPDAAQQKRTAGSFQTPAAGIPVAPILSDTAYMTPPLGGEAGSDTAAASSGPVPAAGAPQPATPGTAAEAAKGGQPGSDVIKAKDASEPSFHFGIFAASGSGVVVESAPEIPSIQPPKPTLTSTKPASPAKKGFLQMLGWGKKEAAAPTGGSAQGTPPGQSAGDVDGEEPTTVEEAPVDRLGETPYDGSPIFEIPEDDEIVTGENDTGENDSGTDEALKDFFNNFK